jgi:catechol 2,3-dioxygenase-like lactoylglutathione lyase family enzyme
LLLRDNRDVVWPPEVAENFGLARAQGRGALLALGPEEHHVRLDLIEWLEPRWEGASPGGTPAEHVPRIIAIRTRNVRAAYRALSARGIEFIREPRPPDPALGIESVVCCRDPDGTLIELIEYMPGVLGSRIDHLPKRPRSS